MVRRFELVMDEADHDAIQRAMAVRQSFKSYPDAVSAGDDGEEWKAGDPLADGSNLAGLIIAEICRGWEDMLDMEVLSRPREEHFRAIVAAVKRIMAEPYGCFFCDSGKLRNPAKGHSDDCGFYMAQQALAKVDGGQSCTS